MATLRPSGLLQDSGIPVFQAGWSEWLFGQSKDRINFGRRMRAEQETSAVAVGS